MSERTFLTKAPAFRWCMLLLNVLAYGQFFMTASVPNAFTAQIQADFGLNAFQAGLYYTLVLAVFALTGSIGAKAADKLGLKKCVCLGILFNLIGSVLIPVLGTTIIGYGICCFLQGLCGGMMCGLMISSTAFWFPIRQRGLATGILLGILGVGFSIATAARDPLIAALGSWQLAAAVLSGVPALVIMVLYFLLSKPVEAVYPGYSAVADLLPPEPAAGGTPRNVDDLPRTMAELRRTRMFWCAGICAFISGCMSYGIPVFVANVLTAKGMEAGMVTLVTTLTLFCTIIGSPLGGVISDRIFKGSRWQIVAIGNGLIAVTLLIVNFTSADLGGGLVVMLAMIATNIASAMCVGPFWAIPAELGHPAIATEVSGIINVFGNSGAFLIPMVYNGAATAAGGSYFVCMYIAIALAVVSAVSICFVRR